MINFLEYQKDLSIIITCCNESRILKPAIDRLMRLFNLTKLNFEIVIVDDYSTDGSRGYIRNLESEYKQITAIFHEKNRGRGAAAATGIKASHGRVVGFNDLDFSTDPIYIIKLYDEIINGADIATAARVYKLNCGSINVLHRYALHKGYKALIKLIFRTPLIDTETGCKFFNRQSILKYIDEIKDNRWFWDTEVMLRGYYRGMKISEVPSLFIRQHSTGSTVKVFRDVMRYLVSVFKFYKEIQGKKLNNNLEKD